MCQCARCHCHLDNAAAAAAACYALAATTAAAAGGPATASAGFSCLQCFEHVIDLPWPESLEGIGR